MPRVVVIGGGISGLACARGLADRLADAEVTVLEAADRPGGAIRTQRERGFTWEAGPNGFLNRHPSTLALALRAGLGDELLSGCEANRRRFVLSGGRLHRFPDSPATFLTTSLLSWPARLRMALEPLVPGARRDREESVARFARRRLGRGAAERLVGPVVTGIYAGDPASLSVQATLPQLAALDGRGRSLLRAYLESRRHPEPPDGAGGSPSTVGRRRLVSFRGGAGRLVEGLAESLGKSLRLRQRVRRVEATAGGFRLEVEGPESRLFEADAVICAAPATSAARLLADLEPDAARACRGIASAPVAMVALGHREADVPHPLDGFGYLVAEDEATPVLGVYWSSSVFPGHRSPEGHVLLQVILGGVRHPEACAWDDDRLLETAADHVARVLGIGAAPVLARLHRHAVGIPQYALGHRERVAAVERACAARPGLFATGNAFRGVGTNACTADAERVVESVARYLTSPDRATRSIAVPATARRGHPAPRA